MALPPTTRMVSYALDGIDEDDWEAFENSYPRSVSIEDVLKGIVGGEHLDVVVDEEGRVELGEEYAGEELWVVIVGSED